jgi:hypothetical protein
MCQVRKRDGSVHNVLDLIHEMAVKLIFVSSPAQYSHIVRSSMKSEPFRTLSMFVRLLVSVTGATKREER